MSASSAIASIVYSILQKPHLNARSRKELTWLFSSAERKPLHAEMAYHILDSSALLSDNLIICMRSIIAIAFYPWPWHDAQEWQPASEHVIMRQ